MKKISLYLSLLLFGLLNLNFSFKKNKKNLTPSPAKPSLLARKTDTQKDSLKIETQEKDIYQALQMYSEVLSLAKDKAYRKISLPQIIEQGLKTSIPSIDPHSAFFSKESHQATMESTSGEFPGIGISVISKTLEDDSLVIIDVLQDGPAAKTGLKSGDKIIEVNGEKLRNLATDEVISKIKGKIGTEVNIKIIRNKKPLEFKVKRDVIKDQTSFCFHFKTPNIYYLGLKIFASTAYKQMTSLLEKANVGQCRGIILDVRRNPGGVLDSVIDVASLFLDKNSLIVTTKDNAKKTTTSYKTFKNPVLKSDVPIFVLIDNFTASASEILAGCLKHYSSEITKDKNKRNLMVFLVGTPTFGKGSVQEVIPVSGGRALKLTTLMYYLPNEKSIQAIGIEPDFTVKPKFTPAEDIKWIEELYGKESSLKNYITEEEIKDIKKSDKEKDKKEVAKKEEEPEKSWKEKRIETLNQDVQIQASINMINLLAFAKKNSPKLVATRDNALKFLKENYLTDDAADIEEVM